MAGIIEKLAPSTDLAGVEVSTKSNTTPGFEACLASQSLAGDGPDQEGPLAALPSESRQSTDGSAVDLTKTLKPIPTEARSESSQATSDAALLIKSLGSMIEPESKPAPAGLEALGKVIALRTGKARVTGAGEGATGIDTLSEKVAGLRAGEGLDVDAALEAVATTAFANSKAQTALDSAGQKTDATLSASNDGSSEFKLALSAKNTPVDTQTAASISVSTSMSDSAKISLGISSTPTQTSGSIAEKSAGSVTPQASTQLSANTMPTQNTTLPTHGDRAPAAGANEAIRASVTDSTMETQALKLSGTPSNAQGSLDEVDAALAPLKEVSAKPGMQQAPTSAQAAEAVSTETLSSASTAQSVKTPSPELKAVNSAAGQTSPLRSVDGRPTEPTVANASSIAMSQDTTRAAAATQSGASTLKEATPKGRTPASSANGNLTETPLANSAGSTNKEAATATAVPASEQAKSSTIGQDSGAQKTQPSTSAEASSRANLRGTEQSARLRSRLEGAESSRNEQQTKASPRVAVREVVNEATKLVRPTQRPERPEKPSRSNRPALTASKRVQVLGRALNAEVVDAEVARGPRELSIAKTAMRSRVTPRLRGSEPVSKLGASAMAPLRPTTPAAPVEGATVVAMPKPDRAVESAPFKLRFNESAMPQNTTPLDGAASREVVGESIRASLRTPVADQKTSSLPADGLVNKTTLEGDPEGQPSLGQDQNAGQRQGNQDRSGQKFTQTASLNSNTTDTKQASESSFSEAVDSQLETTDDTEDATLRLRQESSKTSTSARHLERSITGRTAQSSNQAQAQASMRQDMLHRLSAAEVPGHVSNLIFRNQEQARLQLHPAELGRMNLELQVKAGEVQLKVAVESAAAAAEIQSQLGQLKEQLQSQGLKLGDVSVDVSQKDFDSDAQSASGEDREQGENSGREREARQADEQEQAVKKTKKREKSADGRLDVIA